MLPFWVTVRTACSDAAMLSELARTGFYKKIEVKSRLAQERRALLHACEVAIKMRMNTENTIRGLLASLGSDCQSICKPMSNGSGKLWKGRPFWLESSNRC